jgi:hypothetical protein
MFETQKQRAQKALEEVQVLAHRGRLKAESMGEAAAQFARDHEDHLVMAAGGAAYVIGAVAVTKATTVVSVIGSGAVCLAGAFYFGRGFARSMMKESA